MDLESSARASPRPVRHGGSDRDQRVPSAYGGAQNDLMPKSCLDPLDQNSFKAAFTMI